MPSDLHTQKIDVRGGPSRRSCRSWRNPLLIASATTSEATPAATPTIEMPVMIR